MIDVNFILEWRVTYVVKTTTRTKKNEKKKNKNKKNEKKKNKNRGGEEEGETERQHERNCFI